MSTISHEKVHDNEVMVSFDLESLFTNIPIEGAVQTTLRKLENDSDLSNHTNLTPTQIADLLNFVLRSTHFKYNGSIYEQEDGAAMGRRVSAVIASVLMKCLLTLLPVITNIANRSLEGAFMPNALKCAMITPLLKKPNLDPEEFKNFRPVSNLPLTHISLQYHT